MIPILWLDEVPSTNAYAKERFLRENDTALSAVAARRQTAGRGRLGRVWESAPDEALALSVTVPRAMPGAVTLAVGIAVVRAIGKTCGVKTQLKWPNDILCNNRKIGGILCEGIVGERCATVIGIGLNLAQSVKYFEEKGLSYGGSLRSVAGQSVSPQTMATAVLSELENVLSVLENQGFATLKEEYEAACLTLHNAVSVLDANGRERFCATAVSVDDEGNLIVRDDAGDCRAVNAGEVSVRGVYGYV